MDAKVDMHCVEGSPQARREAMRDIPAISGDLAALTVHENLAILKTRRADRWRRNHHHDNSREQDDESPRSRSSRSRSTSSRSTELVEEDVYLMDNKHRRAHANLLANSLTARLRKNLPDDPKLQQSAMRKIRRDSLKDFVHLDNLNRQYTCEMNWESNRLDKESNQIMRRHSKLQRHSEQQRRYQEKLESSLRSRSGLSSASLFPRLVDSGAAWDQDSPDGVEEFPEFAKVDKDDLSHVKFFKFKGVFMPHNKYSSRIEPFEISSKVKRKTNEIQDSLKMADTGSPVDLPPRSRMSKKNLRVSWSSHSRYYRGDGDDDSLISPSRADTRLSRPDTRLENISPDKDDNRGTPSTVKSFKSFRSDGHLKKHRQLKPQEKLETVGVQWKVPKNKNAVNEVRPVISPTKLAPKLAPGEVSRVLIPVTAAMDKEGLSPNKMRWQVQKMAAGPGGALGYQSWLEKMEALKGSSLASSSCVPSPVQKLPNRMYLSVMATRVQ